MNDDELELASAYLDDEVTDDERARVEATPELLGLVEELRAVREAVARTEPPSAETREAAVAAALAAFDPEQAPAPPPNVVPIEQAGRWRWRHGLGVAAAAIVVVVAGVAILRDNAEAPSDVQTAERASPPASTVAGAALDAEEFDADSAAESNAALPPPAAAAPAPGAVATLAPLPEVTTTAELVALAERLVDERGASLPDRRDARDQCRDDEELAAPVLAADAVYIDEDGVRYDIVVADDSGEAVGVDLESCDLVISADH